MSTFNSKSLELITNVYNNMSRHYPQYRCCINKEDVSNSISIEILNGNNYINKYYFYPDVISGNIESIAIYGIALQGHYETISKSKNIFGFKVSRISLVTQNTMSPFVDIYIDY